MLHTSIDEWGARDVMFHDYNEYNDNKLPVCPRGKVSLTVKPNIMWPGHRFSAKILVGGAKRFPYCIKIQTIASTRGL